MSIERILDLYEQAIRISCDPKNTQWVSPLLLVTDATLCALIIWKVPCRPLHSSSPRSYVSAFHISILVPPNCLNCIVRGFQKYTDATFRYRNRLDDLYGAGFPLPFGRTRLYTNQRRDRTARISCSTCLHL